ncbi:LytTR family DNA-binding domain-containing protein [Fulvivirgaceae bacterium PWU4]|uniref:LytTR family DNA-binding domain-containing protein n=1 Tax=Chryseosolibacter histidini TaxID=2782349 RepID=A0AAP2DJQ1_9BACT|nr:LytTR family DNA-binding domain-containing protein [Chryseosolibacter histidini]MBT1696769.1 LytTR family DNA-binding domain-containing protein [Chryseosolibacter histidini]
MKCIIVDDEPLAIEILEAYVAKVEQLELAGTFRNAVSAFTFLQQHTVDLIFLDIQMPKLSGIDFLKTLRNPPKVIFTTAFRDYAIEGFDLEVADYLLKPIPFERFLKAVAKVLHQPAASASQPQAKVDEDYVYFKVDKKMVKTRMADILYIESIKDYVKVRTPEREIITQQKISYLEESLPREQFIRIHRSFIVNREKIDAYSATDVEIGKFHVPIGRNYKNDVMKVLGKNVF